MLILPEEHRKLFQEPFGELHRTIEDIIPRFGKNPLYAVGDVVTHNLHKNHILPEVAVVDGFTMRSPCSRIPAVRGECIRIKNPAGTITGELESALEYAVTHPPVTIFVDGEEDLAVIPLVIAAPMGAIVLYGQPDEGVVFRIIDPEAKATARRFLDHFIRSDE
ncbi:MAG: GTP-dependent dephospho-CoA kinase [Methanoregula sp. SKADARSKE-2]|nr:MAG: GTP-dependent dephospho-CoA kinase [Methanoregula sp. SKADARSKE-2]